MADQAKISLKGVIKRILPTQQVSDKFKKREIWLRENGEHPQTFCIEFHQDTCSALDNFSDGDSVQCFINLRGRHWSKNGKEGVMNTIQCWKIVKEGQSVPQRNQEPTKAEEPSDDLPF